MSARSIHSRITCRILALCSLRMAPRLPSSTFLFSVLGDIAHPMTLLAFSYVPHRLIPDCSRIVYNLFGMSRDGKALLPLL